MMRTVPLVLLVLAGCPDDPAGNGSQLWLAPDGVETEVHLVDAKPYPF